MNNTVNRILVTRGCGFIGVNLRVVIRYWLSVIG
jgi:hypothetical protein